MIQLFKSILGASGVQFLGKAVSVVSGIVFARVLGVEQYGLYGYMLSIVTILTIPVIAGLPSLIIREVSKYKSNGEWAKINGLLNWSFYYVIALSGFVTIVIYSLWGEGEYKDYLLSGGAFVLFKSLLTQQSAVLNSIEKNTISQISIHLILPVITILIFLIHYFFIEKLTALKLSEIVVFSLLLTFLLSLTLYNTYKKDIHKSSSVQYEYKIWHTSLIPLSMVAVIGVINSELATVILGVYCNNTSVAYFRVGVQIVSLLLLGLSSINIVIMPKVALTYKNKEYIKTQQVLTQSVRLSAMFSIPILMLLLLVGKVIIEYLFGIDFVDSYIVVVILCIGQLVNVLMGSVGLVLNMTNNEYATLRATLISTILNIALMFLFIPIYAEVGAAISITISLIIWNAIMAYEVKQRTGLITWFK